jgi:hypothetical protein
VKFARPTLVYERVNRYYTNDSSCGKSENCELFLMPGEAAKENSIWMRTTAKCRSLDRLAPMTIIDFRSAAAGHRWVELVRVQPAWDGRESFESSLPDSHGL